MIEKKKELSMDWSILTEREIEILKMLAHGQNNKNIAEELCVSIYTVKNHVSNILHKLPVADRTQAAILAINKGLMQS